MMYYKEYICKQNKCLLLHKTKKKYFPKGKKFGVAVVMKENRRNVVFYFSKIIKF